MPRPTSKSFRAKPNNRGLGALELIIAALLVWFLLLGTYKLLSTTSKKGIEATREEQSNLETKKFLDRLATEIANVPYISGIKTVAAPAPLAAETTIIYSGTVLRHKAPISGLSCDGWEVPTALMAYPGYARQDINGQNGFEPFDPSVANVSAAGKENDAIHFVFLTPTSQPLPLALQPTGAPFSTSGHNPIILKAAPNNATAQVLVGGSAGVTPMNQDVLHVGDFALISDAPARPTKAKISDLFRVTKITSTTAGISLERASEYSIWNERSFNHPASMGYGALDGIPYVQRVQIATYAFNPADGIIYRDNHETDDGFVPGSGLSPMSPKLTRNWQPALNHVKRFRIFYQFEDGETRTPRSNFANETACTNQIGFPNLRRLRIEIDTAFKSHERIVDPVNLTHGEVVVGGGLGGGPRSYTPTPEVSRTPWTCEPNCPPSPTPCEPNCPPPGWGGGGF